MISYKPKNHNHNLCEADREQKSVVIFGMSESQNNYDHLVGKTYVKGPNATTSANSFSLADLPPATRVIFPDEMVTMDFVPERLNVAVSAEGVALRVYFG